MGRQGQPEMIHRHDQHAGFTLIEIGIVIVIIGFLLAAVVKGQSLLSSAKVHDIIAISQDLSSSIRDFKQRYHMYPGDMSINAATPEIPGVSTQPGQTGQCLAGGANAGNSNGIIDASESPCVPEVLGRSGFISKLSTDPTTLLYAIKTPYGPASVMASSVALSLYGILMPPTVLNVLILTNLPCEIATEIEGKLDDGSLAAGNVRASVTTCTPSGPPVPFFAIGL